MLRCLVFFGKLPIVNALSEFLNIEKIGHRYVIFERFESNQYQSRARFYSV